MRGGQVRWVRIEAGVDRECRLKSPFGEVASEVVGSDLERNGGTLTWSMKAGQEVVLFTEGYRELDLEQEAGEIRAMAALWLSV